VVAPESAPAHVTPAPEGPASDSLVLILPGRAHLKPAAASDLERIAPDLLPRMKDLTQLDAVEICRRQSNELNPLPVAEPVSFLLNCAYGRELIRRGVKVDVVAGYSLGEYAALVLTSAIDFETGLRLVRARAEAIEEVIREKPLRMVRVEGADPEVIAELCTEQGDVWPATFDSPRQMIVGGEPRALDRVAPRFRDAGAERIVLVLNNGGLHTPPMKRASDAIADQLAQARIVSPQIPVASSISAQIETDPQRWHRLLAEQMHSPVRWHDTISALPQGPLVECGGNRLAELVLLSQPGRKTYAVDSVESIGNVVAQLTAA
jgi:[acyl-carrier-protein] S-malonyltransferase